MSGMRVGQVEAYIRETLADAAGNSLLIAHDFKHVDRVRNWALEIAKGEGFQELELLEIAALLHDIGLPFTEEADRRLHGQIGAEIAEGFLKKNQIVPNEETEMIAYAIRYHGAAPSLVAKLVSEEGKTKVVGGGQASRNLRNGLVHLLRDADIMDVFGAVGLMRMFTSRAYLPEYDPMNIRGETWELSVEEFDKRKANGSGVGSYIVDHINFTTIAYFDALHTETARRFAVPMIEFTKAFLTELETEVLRNRR